MAGFLLGTFDLGYSVATQINSYFRSFDRFFHGGVGELEQIQKHEDLLRDIAQNKEKLQEIQVNWRTFIPKGAEEMIPTGSPIIEYAEFQSPCAEILPFESKKGYFQLIRPANKSMKDLKGIVIHAAATGDETYRLRRMLVADPLLQHDIASILLMIPCYGERKPFGQPRHFVTTVSDYSSVNNHTFKIVTIT